MNDLRLRIIFLAMAIFGFLAALWGGWVRIGWPWPVLIPMLPANHGVLMVCAFLGTLICLERATALRQHWMYTAPLLTGLGGILLVFGILGVVGPALITAGSLVFCAIFVIILKRHFTLYTVVMALGALCWLAGNALWLGGLPVYRLVLWWAGFLILTIAGERLELGRIQRLPRTAERLFILCVAVFMSGMLLSVFNLGLGTRLAGVAMIGIGSWLLRFDITRRTIRQKELPRFIAVSLISGYIWLLVSGVFALIYAPLTAGPIYDAYLHTVFIGFVISMIFGHSPIIFPAVLGIPIAYTPAFYIPLGLLHFSLVMRVLGDLAFNPAVRRWGGILNGTAILLFLLILGSNLIKERIKKHKLLNSNH